MKQILVLGVTGGIGKAVADQFLAKGWKVLALQRDPEAAKLRFPDLEFIHWIKGDALNEADVVRAAKGCSHIFHGVNPPKYKNWRGLALPMLANSIKAAEVQDARLIFPGNVYNYDPKDGEVICEETRQNPISRKGAVRAEMEQMLGAATCRSLLVRAGDFFGHHAPGAWFQTVMVTPGKRVEKVMAPELGPQGHAWAYLPDLAATIYKLVENEAKLAPRDQFHFTGHYLDGQKSMSCVIRQQAGLTVRKQRVPWFLFKFISPFVPLLKEVMEMKYLWEVPLKLDNRKLESLIGKEPRTPIDLAVKESLVALKCV